MWFIWDTYNRCILNLTQDFQLCIIRHTYSYAFIILARNLCSAYKLYNYQYQNSTEKNRHDLGIDVLTNSSIFCLQLSFLWEWRTCRGHCATRPVAEFASEFSGPWGIEVTRVVSRRYTGYPTETEHSFETRRSNDDPCESLVQKNLPRTSVKRCKLDAAFSYWLLYKD